MPRKPKSKADQLLALHIKYELDALTGDQLQMNLRREVNALFDWMTQTQLNQVSDVERIMGIIRRVVIELELHGGIPEIAGEMAIKIFKAEVHRQTKLKEVMNQHQLKEFTDQVLHLEDQRRRAVKTLLNHPLYGEFISSILYQALTRYIYDDNFISRTIPGVSPMMKFGKRMFSKAAPELDASIQSSIKTFIARNLNWLIQESEVFLTESLTSEQLRESVLDVWNKVENETLAKLAEGMEDVDLDEFIMLTYEYWLEFRQTPYFEKVCRVVVEALFEKYGDAPLSELVTDMSVTREILLQEAEISIPPLLKQLREHGYLEGLLKRRLQPFYNTKAVRDLLADE